MKNVLPHDVRTLIIAGIVATIIPTPIDFNNLIIFIRGVHFPNIFPYYAQLVYKY
jgi:hypothetical protein